MELIKDIYFNTDKLVENTKVKVSYTGKFYQGNNDKVFIHYGYGENWNNLKDSEMIKTDLGYQTELELIGGNTLNFCFKNQNNEWDNNNGENYVFAIESAKTNDLGTTSIGTPQNETASFFGKTFGEGESTSSNVYWNSNADVLPGIEENLNVPSGIDTYIDITPACDNVNNIVNTIDMGSLNTSVSKDTLGTQNLDTIVAPNNIVGDTVFGTVQAKQPVSTNNQANTFSTNSLAIINTSFQKTVLWTKKIKTQVFKFFSYVPKFISGNYKRKIENNNK